MGEWQETEFGRVPAHWELLSMDELKAADKSAVAMGPFGSNIKAENFVASGVPVIRGTNFNVDRHVAGEFVFLTERKADELKGSNCKPGDLVFTHRGTLGQVALIPKSPFDRYVISQSGMKFTPDTTKVDPEYLLYFFKSKFGQHQLLKNESQVGVPSISNPLTSLKQVEVPIPSMKEQRAIVGTLSGLDNKIDLLHRQNQTIERLAESVVGQWFIGNYEESGGEVATQTLGSFICTISETYKFSAAPVVFLNTSDIYSGAVLNNVPSRADSLPGQAKKRIRRNDILFSEIRPANRRFAYIDFDSNNYVVSTKLMVLRSKSVVPPAILYFYLIHPTTLDWLQLMAESRSGTFPQITFDQVSELSIRLPREQTLMASAEWAESAIRKMSQNRKQIASLAQLRDLLLPKLMNGDVTLTAR